MAILFWQASSAFNYRRLSKQSFSCWSILNLEVLAVVQGKYIDKIVLKASQDRDEQIRKHREESTEMQKRLQVQLEGRETQLDDLMEKLERQNERKEELKQQLQEKETELEDIKKAYRY